MVKLLQDRSLPRTDRLLKVGLSVAVIVMIATVVVVFVGFESHGLHQSRPVENVHSEEAFTLQQSLEREFELFGTPTEELSRPMKRAVGEEPMEGLNWALAQRLHLRGISPIWAVPGEDMVCLFGLLWNRRGQPLYGATCVPNARAKSGGAFISYLNDAGTGSQHPWRLIAGIAPVGVKAVIAQTGHHAVRIEVKRGVFARRDRGRQPPDQVSPIHTAPGA